MKAKEAPYTVPGKWENEGTLQRPYRKAAGLYNHSRERGNPGILFINPRMTPGFHFHEEDFPRENFRANDVNTGPRPGLAPLPKKPLLYLIIPNSFSRLE